MHTHAHTYNSNTYAYSHIYTKIPYIQDVINIETKQKMFTCCNNNTK